MKRFSTSCLLVYALNKQHNGQTATRLVDFTTYYDFRGGDAADHGSVGIWVEMLEPFISSIIYTRVSRKA